ncbi:MAG: hypothetical protein WAK17_23840 [Candidatus Nitrosopolaris sp.]
MTVCISTTFTISPDLDFTVFKNITAPNGDFSVKYRFLQAGTHQITTRINPSNPSFKALTSFKVIVML